MIFWWKREDKKDDNDEKDRREENGAPEIPGEPQLAPIPGSPRILTPDDLAEEMRRMIEQIMPQMAPLIDQMARDIQRALESGQGKGEIRIFIGPAGAGSMPAPPQQQPPKQPDIPVEVIPTEDGVLVVAQVGELDPERVSVELQGNTVIIGDGTIGKAIPIPVKGDSQRSKAVLRNGILEIRVAEGDVPGEIEVER